MEIAPFCEIEITGGPCPQPRPRATIRGGHASVYEAAADHRIHNWKAYLMVAAQKAMAGRAPVKFPVRAVVLFRMWRPDNPPRWLVNKDMKRENPQLWKRNVELWRQPDALIPHASRPDTSNLIKSVEDALNTIVWADDAQICDMPLRKRYCMHGEPPGVTLRAYEARFPWLG